MTMRKLYDRDFYAWSMETARLLREQRFAELDLEDLVEEVESLGKSQQKELWNRLGTLMEHLLYIAYLTKPSQGERWGWDDTVREQRRQLAKLLRDNPSLKHWLDETMAEAYSDIRDEVVEKSRKMHRERDIDWTVAEEDLPQTCPWKIGELLTKGLYFTRAEMERRMEPPSLHT